MRHKSPGSDENGYERDPTSQLTPQDEHCTLTPDLPNKSSPFNSLDPEHYLFSLLYDEDIDPHHNYYPSHTSHSPAQKDASSFQAPESGTFPTHFLLEKVDALKENIQEITSQLQARLRDNDTFKGQIDSDISRLEFMLGELNKHWTLGNSASIELRRMHLERELNLLNNQKRLTIVTAWKDIVWLKKYLRELVREYESLKRVRELFE